MALLLAMRISLNYCSEVCGLILGGASAANGRRSNAGGHTLHVARNGVDFDIDAVTLLQLGKVGDLKGAGSHDLEVRRWRRHLPR